MSATAVRETRTGYLETAVTRTPTGEHVLHRRAGTDRPARPEPEDPMMGAVAAVVGPGCVASPGHRADGGWRHRVPGPAPLALLLSAGVRPEALLAVAQALGEALAHVHTRAPRTGLPEPSGLARLRGWAAADADPAGPGTLAADLGGTVTQVLADLDAAAAALPAVTLLGAPGSQTVYPDPAGGPPTVLVTDELATGAPAWDLGWVVGELLERSLTAPAEPLAQAARQVLTAYTAAGGSAHPEHVAAAAVARVLVHLHDYATYVGWDESLRDRARAAAHWRTDDDLVGRWCTAG